MTIHRETDIERVKFSREAGAVRRLHVHKIIGEYDVAQHTFGALCLLRIIYPEASKNLIWAVLSHDKPERLTGDIPSPAKNNGNWFDHEKYSAHEAEILSASGLTWPVLTQEEAVWLKVVDSLEFWLFCIDQDMLGNKTLVNPKSKIEEYIEKSFSYWPDKAKNFYLELINNPNLWKMCDELG